MAQIPEDAKTFLEEGRLAYVATVSEDGAPHCVPKGSMAALDDEHLAFADLYAGTTKSNLERNPRVAVTIVNPPAYRGFLFKGRATVIPRGEEFDRIAAGVQRGQLDYRRAKHVVKIRVDHVIDLSQ